MYNEKTVNDAYLFSGISLFFSTQLRNTLILQLTTCCRTDSIGAIFCAPLDTGSTITLMSKAASAGDLAGNFITLKYQNIIILPVHYLEALTIYTV